jgi:hypothetical protein
MSLPESWPNVEVKDELVFTEPPRLTIPELPKLIITMPPPPPTPELCASCGSQNSRPCHKCNQTTGYCFSCNHNVRNHKCVAQHPSEKKLQDLQSVFNEVAGLAVAAENLMKGDKIDRIVQESLDHDRRIHEQEKEQLRRLLDKMKHDFVLSAKAHEKRIAELISEHETTVDIYKNSVKKLEEEVKNLKFNTLERGDIEKKLVQLRGLPKIKRGGAPTKSTVISENDVEELQTKLTIEESQTQSKETTK